jgi:hypothetical protein
MSFDHRHRAITADSIILSKAKADLKYAGLVENLHNYVGVSDQMPSGGKDLTHLSEFAKDVKKLTEDAFGIETRSVELGRRWDILHYLLSPTRRAGKASEGSCWIEVAVLGGDVLGGNAFSTSGQPIRYIDPVSVLKISNSLSEIPTNTLIVNWDVPKMVKAGVETMTGEERLEDLAWAEVDLNNLKEFYWKVSTQDEGVLTFYL